MKSNLYIFACKDFKGHGKWAGGRWAKLTMSNGEVHRFEENWEEMAFRLPEGTSVVFSRGWEDRVDRVEEFMCNPVAGRFLRFH